MRREVEIFFAAGSGDIEFQRRFGIESRRQDLFLQRHHWSVRIGRIQGPLPDRFISENSHNLGPRCDLDDITPLVNHAAGGGLLPISRFKRDHAIRERLAINDDFAGKLRQPARFAPGQHHQQAAAGGDYRPATA